MVTQSWLGYFCSLAQEISVQSSRVRNLIGDRHWPCDGHHKEYLLTALLKRHLPATVLVSRGFVVDPSSPAACSPEQDILIVDSRTHGPLFHQGSLIIALPRDIIASISVKTKLDNTTLRDTIKNQVALRTILCASDVSANAIWCGAYFFETGDPIKNNPESVYNTYATFLRDNCRKSVLSDTLSYTPTYAPDAIASDGDSDFVYTINAFNDPSNPDKSELQIRGFQCGGLATAIFLAIALDHVASRLGEPTATLSPILDQPCIEPLSQPNLIF